MPRRRIAPIAVCALAALIAFAPWGAKNIAWAGNPFFPEATVIFGNAPFTPEKVDRWTTAHSPRADQQALAGRSRALLNDVLVDWRCGFAILVLAAGCVVRLRSRESRALAFYVLIVLAVWLGATHLVGRFFVPALPGLALLIGVTIRDIHAVRRLAESSTSTTGPVQTGVLGYTTGAPRWRLPLWLFAAVGCGVSLVTLLFHAAPRLTPIADAIGIIGSRDPWLVLSIVLPPETIEILKRDDKPLALVGDAQAFLYPLPPGRLKYCGVFDVPGNSTDAVSGWFSAMNVKGTDDTRVLVSPGELARFGRTYRNVPPMTRDDGSGPRLYERVREVPR